MVSSQISSNVSEAPVIWFSLKELGTYPLTLLPLIWRISCVVVLRHTPCLPFLASICDMPVMWSICLGGGDGVLISQKSVPYEFQITKNTRDRKLSVCLRVKCILWMFKLLYFHFVLKKQQLFLRFLALWTLNTLIDLRDFKPSYGVSVLYTRHIEKPDGSIKKKSRENPGAIPYFF